MLSIGSVKGLCTLAGAGVVLSAAGLAAWSWADPLRDAHHAFQQRRWSIAAQSAVSYLESHPASKPALLLAARSYYQLKQWEKAETYYSQIDESDTQDREQRAKALTFLDKWDAAAELYEQLHWENPDSPQLLQQLAATRIGQGKFDEAIEVAQKLANFADYSRVARYLMGTAYHQKFEFVKAVEYFESILAEDADLSDVVIGRQGLWVDLGSALLSLARLDQAQQRLEQGAVLFDSAEILDLLAQVHEAKNDAERAEQYWIEALQTDPKYIKAIVSLARLSLKQSDTEKAIDYLKRATQVNPDDLTVRSNLAVAYARAGRTDQAEEQNQIAQQLRRLNHLRELYEYTASRNPHGPEARLLDAIREMEQQRFGPAERLLQELLREHPDFGPAQKALELLPGDQASLKPSAAQSY